MRLLQLKAKQRNNLINEIRNFSIKWNRLGFGEKNVDKWIRDSDEQLTIASNITFDEISFIATIR